MIVVTFGRGSFPRPDLRVHSTYTSTRPTCLESLYLPNHIAFVPPGENSSGKKVGKEGMVADCRERKAQSEIARPFNTTMRAWMSGKSWARLATPAVQHEALEVVAPLNKLL